MFRAPRRPISGNGFTHLLNKEEFQRRQTADLARYEDADGEYVVRRRPFHERLEEMDKANHKDAYNRDETAIETEDDQSASESEGESPARMKDVKDDAGEEGWRNKEGERLADFGVDEIADFYDEDDLPLAELMRRRKAAQ